VCIRQQIEESDDAPNAFIAEKNGTNAKAGTAGLCPHQRKNHSGDGEKSALQESAAPPQVRMATEKAEESTTPVSQHRKGGTTLRIRDGPSQ
jgi:hypothetical protein